MGGRDCLRLCSLIMKHHSFLALSSTKRDSASCSAFLGEAEVCLWHARRGRRS